MLFFILPLVLAATPGEVLATVETEPVQSSGDAADDIAIWIHPTDPSSSLVIGTDKQRGLEVYDLQGKRRQSLADGDLNNVDLRYNFPLGGLQVPLVAASNRSNNSIALYTVDVGSRTLKGIAAKTITVGISIYGCCLYRSPISGEFFFFATSKDGNSEQWRLFDDGSGRVDGQRVRAWDVGSACEGCACDDHHGWWFVSEEGVGIWRYGAEPSDGTSRVKVDSTGSGGHLHADVEGLALYEMVDGAGYLIASSQGSNEFVIYERGNGHPYVTTFKIASGNGIDSVTDADGIDVTNFPLDSRFPSGAFISQDGQNDLGNQNFKLVPWESLAILVKPPLGIDTRFDPRTGGATGIEFYTTPLGVCSETSDCILQLKAGGAFGFTEFAILWSMDLSSDTSELKSPMVVVLSMTSSSGAWQSSKYDVPPGLAGLVIYSQAVLKDPVAGDLKRSAILPTRIE